MKLSTRIGQIGQQIPKGLGWAGVGLVTALLLIWLMGGPTSAEILFQTSPFNSPVGTPTPTSTATPFATTPFATLATEPTGDNTVPPTATLTPSFTPTVTPSFTPSSTPTITGTKPLTATPSITTTLTVTATVDPALQPPGPADPTPIPTPSPTVDLSGMLAPIAIPTARPVNVPTVTPVPDRVLLAATMFDRAVASLAWLWLICGSFIFFIVAGIVVGLGLTGRISHRRRNRGYGSGGYGSGGFGSGGFGSGDYENDPFSPTGGTLDDLSGWSAPGPSRRSDRLAQRDDDDNWPASLP